MKLCRRNWNAEIRRSAEEVEEFRYSDDDELT